jgi:hypothetical protein
MLRILAVLVSTLVAMSAQAQDAPTAPPAEGTQPDPLLGSRAPLEGDHPLSPTAKPAQPDAGTDATTPDEPDDCGMEQSFFDQAAPPVAIRIYPPATPAASPEGDGQPLAWDIPPAVFKVGRCGRKYIIQIKSESKERYAIKDATLFGPGGEILKVIRIRSGTVSRATSINVITVERAKNVSEPDLRVIFFQVIGADGRTFVLQAVKFP